MTGNTKWYISLDTLCDLCIYSLIFTSHFSSIVPPHLLYAKLVCGASGGEFTLLRLNTCVVGSEEYLLAGTDKNILSNEISGNLQEVAILVREETYMEIF